MCRCDEVRADLMKLSARQRAVLILNRRDRMSYEQIANALSITEDEVLAAMKAGLFLMTIMYKARKVAA